MGIFLVSTDFATGDILLSQNDSQEINIQVTIDRMEVDILQDLFGSELYDLFISDLAGTPEIPTTERFTDVFEPFLKDEDCPRLKSDGILRMLKRFIWAEHVRNQPASNTAVGMVQSVEQNSKHLTPAQYGWSPKYNEAVYTYSAIQAFMIRESDIYPEFKGICKDLSGVI